MAKHWQSGGNRRSKVKKHAQFLSYLPHLYKLSTPCFFCSLHHREQYFRGVPSKICCGHLQIQDGVQNGRHFDLFQFLGDISVLEGPIYPIKVSYERCETALFTGVYVKDSYCMYMSNINKKLIFLTIFAPKNIN